MTLNETTLRENLQIQMSWLKSCQVLKPGHHSDGAIARRPDKQWVTPYFANYAAMALLEEPSAHLPVERYLDWYLRHIENDGTILDYHFKHGTLNKTTRPDSEDAYAGTYLSLVFNYYSKTGRTGWIKKNLPALIKVANVITRLMDWDGLTFALSDHPVKYLMDNCEAYQGLKEFANLLRIVGNPEATYYYQMAGKIAGGIEKWLWNQQRFWYYPSKGSLFKTRTNWRKFYPDATAQAFPVICGLIEPHSHRGAGIYTLFNRHQPRWVTIEPPEHPWMLLAYYACLQGDHTRAGEKLRHAWTKYIIPQSANWYCAEAAFFILTCSLLLKRINDHFPGYR